MDAVYAYTYTLASLTAMLIVPILAETKIVINRPSIPLVAVSDCGVEKACLFMNKRDENPETCCDFALSYKLNSAGTGLDVQVVGNHDGHIALGFTNGTTANSDSVVFACSRDRGNPSLQNGEMRAYRYTASGGRFTDDVSGINYLTESILYRDNWTDCKFEVTNFKASFGTTAPRVLLSYGNISERNAPTSVTKAAISSAALNIDDLSGGGAPPNEYVCGTDRESDPPCKSGGAGNTGGHTAVTAALILVASAITFCLLLL